MSDWIRRVAFLATGAPPGATSTTSTTSTTDVPEVKSKRQRDAEKQVADLLRRNGVKNDDLVDLTMSGEEEEEEEEEEDETNSAAGSDEEALEATDEEEDDDEEEETRPTLTRVAVGGDAASLMEMYHMTPELVRRVEAYLKEYDDILKANNAAKKNAKIIVDSAVVSKMLERHDLIEYNLDEYYMYAAAVKWAAGKQKRMAEYGMTDDLMSRVEQYKSENFTDGAVAYGALEKLGLTEQDVEEYDLYVDGVKSDDEIRNIMLVYKMSPELVMGIEQYNADVRRENYLRDKMNVFEPLILYETYPDELKGFVFDFSLEHTTPLVVRDSTREGKRNQLLASGIASAADGITVEDVLDELDTSMSSYLESRLREMKTNKEIPPMREKSAAEKKARHLIKEARVEYRRKESAPRVSESKKRAKEKAFQLIFAARKGEFTYMLRGSPVTFSELDQTRLMNNGKGTEFVAALKKVNKSLQSDPENAGLLAQKETIEDELKSVETKRESLKNLDKEMREAFRAQHSAEIEANVDALFEIGKKKLRLEAKQQEYTEQAENELDEMVEEAEDTIATYTKTARPIDPRKSELWGRIQTDRASVIKTLGKPAVESVEADVKEYKNTVQEVTRARSTRMDYDVEYAERSFPELPARIAKIQSDIAEHTRKIGVLEGLIEKSRGTPKEIKAYEEKLALNRSALVSDQRTLGTLTRALSEGRDAFVQRCVNRRNKWIQRRVEELSS